MKKIVLFFMVSLLLCLCPLRADAGEYIDDASLISDYYGCIQEGDFTNLLSTLGNEYAIMMESYVDNIYYQQNNLGVFNIEAVNDFCIINEVGKDLYFPIIEECEGEGIAIYLVQSDLNVHKESEFYFEGKNYHLFFVATIDNSRKIVAYRMPLPQTIEEYAEVSEASTYTLERFGESASTCSTTCSYNSLPSSITVARWKYGNGVIESVNFLNYVKTVACAELGYVSRNQNYHYAGSLAIRNYAWYKILTADSNASYHVTDTNETNSTYTASYQVYNPNTYWNNSTWQTIYNRVDAIWNRNFFSSDYNFFLSWYTSASSLGGEASGRMNLNIANDLANSGKNYQEILNYFYGYSDKSSGDLYFCYIGSHVYYKSISSGNSVLLTCKCGYKETQSVARAYQ